MLTSVGETKVASARRKALTRQALGRRGPEMFCQVIQVRPEEWSRLIPHGPPGEPSEVGQMCEFFLAGEESVYMTVPVLIEGRRMSLNDVVPVPEEARG